VKIAYIGNFGPSFSTESHVAAAFESLGHQVVRHQEDEVDWRWVPAHAAAQGVDFVLWTHTHGYADESKHDDCWFMLQGLRDVGIPSVAFHLDRWWGLERQTQAETEPFFRCDLVFTADGGHAIEWAKVGVNHFWLPPAVDHREVGRGTPNSRWRKDVGFVGSWREYGHAEVWPWRFELISAIWRRYGSKFRSWPRSGESIRGQDLADLYASVKVVVGDSCLAGGATRYWSDRIPETLGRGGFLLHPDVYGLDDHFGRDMLPIRFDVGDIEGVFDLVDYWMDDDRADERRALTEQAIGHVRDHHTYRNRAETVIASVDRWRTQ